MSKFAEFPDETDVRGSGGSYIEASAKVWKYAGTATGVENLRESSQRDANWIFYRLADVLLMKRTDASALGTMTHYPLRYELVSTIYSVI